MANKTRQAVVVVHGMGEQRPVETLNRFSRVITPRGAVFYSRADKVAGSFEARRHLIPRQTVSPDPLLEVVVQTEIYEYHWAHLMVGNRLDDLWPTFRRVLFPAPGLVATLWVLSWLAVGALGFAVWLGPLAGRAPAWLGVALFALGAVAGLGYLLTYVPGGLVVVWLLLWTGIVWFAWSLVAGPFSNVTEDARIPDLVSALLGGGLAAAVAAYLVSRVLPSWLTSSFVDVVRYLDTSPRSLSVRADIRAGIVELLEGLHDSNRYQRVIIVAHSLGSYIAYDAISYLWSQMGRRNTGPAPTDPPPGGLSPAGLAALEQAASNLDDSAESLDAFQEAQWDLWNGLRFAGTPWLITDFVSFGSPMYFADRLYTKNHKQFSDRIVRRELVTCPPQNELADYNNVNRTARFFTWNDRGRRIPHEAAPFALVRWTNLWYPSWLWFFGDWFGGPLRPLYGQGIRDVALKRNRPWRWLPGAAHGLYLSFDEDRRSGSFAGELSLALDLNATLPSVSVP